MFNSSPRTPKKINKKPISCNVYRTSNHQRSPVRAPLPIFKTVQNIDNQESEVLFFNDRILRRKVRNMKVLKECATQTSKTILQLAQENSEKAVVSAKKEEEQTCNISKSKSKNFDSEFQKQSANISFQNVQELSQCTTHECKKNETLHQCEGQNQLPSSPATQKTENIEASEQKNCNIVNVNGNTNTQRTFGATQMIYDPAFCYTYCNFPVINNNTNDILSNQNVPSFQMPAGGDAPPNRNNHQFKIGVQIQILDENRGENKPEEQEKSGQLSPDSLAESPREVTDKLSLDNCSFTSVPKCLSHLSDLTLDGSCHVQDCICNTSSCVLRKPLTQTFLERKYSKNFNDISSSMENLTSKSFIESYYHPNYIQEPFEDRTKIARNHKLRKNNSKTLNLPDNSYTKRRPSAAPSTLMRPTVASSIKSQKEDVQTANQLIPSMRRGRSVSPKPVTNRNHFESSRRIPYIDQSRSDISSETTLINVVRNPEVIRQIADEHARSDYSFQFSEDLFSLASNIDVSNSTINETLIDPALEKLCQHDWKTALRGLADIVEICRVTDLDVILEHMDTINQKVIELLRSPRSHVSRAACKAAGHLFEYVKDTRRPAFDEIVNILLHKTADTNKFIRHDANLALDCMVTHIPISNAVRALCSKGPNHKNPLVRCATARLLVCAVVIAGTDSLFNSFTRKTIILTMAKFLEDKNLETRKVAERLYKVLSKDMRFDIYLRKYLEKEQIDKMKKNLIFIRKN